jgi:hypothetical protein
MNISVFQISKINIGVKKWWQIAILWYFGKTAVGNDSLPYVLNGPIQLFLLKIFMMSVEVDILHNTSMLQD